MVLAGRSELFDYLTPGRSWRHNVEHELKRVSAEYMLCGDDD
jgi:hypothetical protein